AYSARRISPDALATDTAAPALPDALPIARSVSAEGLSARRAAGLAAAAAHSATSAPARESELRPARLPLSVGPAARAAHSATPTPAWSTPAPPALPKHLAPPLQSENARRI